MKILNKPKRTSLCSEQSIDPIINYKEYTNSKVNLTIGATCYDLDVLVRT